MKDFVVYHNPDSMGVDVRIVNPFVIVTNKPAGNDVVGRRVWLLTGEGRPRSFFLRSYFIVDQVETGVEGFQTKLSGSNGRVYEPMIELDQQNWFDELKKTQGNFAFGVQPISDGRVIRGLEDVSGN